MRLVARAAALALFAAAPALAEPPDYFLNIEARLKQCSAAHADIPGSAACEQMAFLAADKTLNSVYRNVMASLHHPGTGHAPYDPRIAQRLLSSERAWVAYRTAECQYRSFVAVGAPLEGFENQQCLYSITKDRVNFQVSSELPQNIR